VGWCVSIDFCTYRTWLTLRCPARLKELQSASPIMPPLRRECCMHCLKHIKKTNHTGNETCAICIPEDRTLHRCDGCRSIRYCVRFTLDEQSNENRDELTSGSSHAHVKRHTGKAINPIAVSLRTITSELRLQVFPRERTLDWRGSASTPTTSL
jgi:hypothetical protein